MRLFAASLLLATTALAQAPVQNDLGPAASGAVFMPAIRGLGVPTLLCNAFFNLGTVYVRSDATGTFSSLYVCAKTGASSFAWEGPYGTGGGGGAWGTITGTLSSQSDLNTALNARLLATNNLSDLNNATTARTNLGLGTASTQATGIFLQTANNLSDLANATTARTNIGFTFANTAALWTGCSGLSSQYLAANGTCQTASGAVASVFGRSGAVVAAANDYNFNQLAGTLATGQVNSPHGNGANIQLNTGATTLNDCAKFDANGNIVDAGAACGVGGGGAVSTVNSVSPSGGNVNVLTTSILDAGQTVTSAACATDCTTVLSTAVNTNNVTVELPAVTAIITNVTFNATNTRIHCNGTIIKAKAGMTGILFTINGTNPKIDGCTFDGNRQTGLDQGFGMVAASGVTGKFTFTNNEVMNCGDFPSANFHQCMSLTSTVAEISGNRIHDGSGYMFFARTKDKLDFHDNELYNSSKQGFMTNTALGDLTDWQINNNKCHDITDSNSAFGSYGNCWNFFQTNGVNFTNNQTWNTEYSGERCANCFNFNGVGNHFRQTGDWGMYNEFEAGTNNVSGNFFSDCLSGGIYAANGAANSGNNNWSTNISGNHLWNCGVGSSTNGATTPYFGEGILATRFTNVTGNTINGSFFGMGVEGTGSTKLAGQGVNFANNLVMDTRERTIAASSPTGATPVVGDTLYVGSAADTALKVCTVVTVISNVSFTCAPVYGVMAAADVLVNDARVGGATITTILGPTLYDLTVNTTTNFNLFDTVTMGAAGAGQSSGTIVCLGGRIASGACPTANHVIASVLENTSGLKVAFPAAGTITDATTTATATVSARATTPVGMSAGLLFNLGDSSVNCTQFSTNDRFWGYSTQAIGAWSANSTTVSALPPSACPTHPANTQRPAISGGGATVGASFARISGDNNFVVNAGTGTLSPIVITFRTPYTALAPSCSIPNDETSHLLLSGTPTTTTYTIGTSNLAASDIIAVSCTGGN